MVDLAHTANGAGEPVVLLHAFPLSSAMWHLPQTLLSDRWRVITPDLRGFGRSPPGDDEPSLDLMADDLAGLLDRLDLDRVVLGGLSMGGYVSMAMLRRHPQRVRALLLMDTKASADLPGAAANRERIATELEDSGSTGVLHSTIDGLLGETTRRHSPATVGQVRAWIDAVDPSAAAWAQRAMAARPDSRPTLASNHVPAAVIVGEEDTLTPHEDALAMAAALREGGTSAVVYIVPEAGHLSVVEQPERACGAIRDALGHLRL